MSNSRLPHVPGARFTQIHDWALREVGLAGAAVIGYIDFLDRNQARSQRPVATRIDICAALQGIAGRDAIDRALNNLVKLGWVIRSSRRLRNNPAEKYKFALDADAICKYLATQNKGSEIRKAHSEFQDEFQTCSQNDTDYRREEEREPPPGKHGEGGGNSASQETNAPIVNEMRHVNAEIRCVEPILNPDLVTFIKGLNLDESTIVRAFEVLKNLASDRQDDLLAVAQQKLPGAYNVAAYLMTLARSANEGSLTRAVKKQPGGTPHSESVIDLMSEAEIAQQIRGKTAIYLGEQHIADVMNDGLYRDGCRFSVSRASKIIRAVVTGELIMR